MLHHIFKTMTHKNTNNELWVSFDYEDTVLLVYRFPL